MFWQFLQLSTNCEEAINLMRLKGFDQFPVKDHDGKTFGVLTANNLLTRLGKRQVRLPAQSTALSALR